MRDSTMRCRTAPGIILCTRSSYLRASLLVYLAARLSNLSDAMVADPLAALADEALSPALAVRRQSLPHASFRRRFGQSRSAHRRRYKDVRRLNAGHRCRIAQCDSYAHVL